MPLRGMAVAFSTVAHWIFTACYLNVALFLSILKTDVRESHSELPRMIKVVNWSMLGVNLVFYGLFFWATIK